MDSYLCRVYLWVIIIRHPRNIDVVCLLIILRYDTFTVLVGVIDLNGSGVLAQSSEIIPYYDYDPNDFHHYSIGLVKLSTPLAFNRTYEI
jgi:hypothetical protein